MRQNLLGRVPSALKDMVAATVRTSSLSPAPCDQSRAPRDRSDPRDQAPESHGFVRAHWRMGRLDESARADQLGDQAAKERGWHLPHDASVTRLVGDVLLDQHDDCAIAERRYPSEVSMALIDATP